MEKHRGHHTVKQYPLWIVGYINKAVRDSSGELFESRYISLSSVVYLTGSQWASGNVLETKATQVKEGIILSLPSAGSVSCRRHGGTMANVQRHSVRLAKDSIWVNLYTGHILSLWALSNSRWKKKKFLVNSFYTAMSLCLGSFLEDKKNGFMRTTGRELTQLCRGNSSTPHNKGILSANISWPPTFTKTTPLPMLPLAQHALTLFLGSFFFKCLRSELSIENSSKHI